MFYIFLMCVIFSALLFNCAMRRHVVAHIWRRPPLETSNMATAVSPDELYSSEPNGWRHRGSIYILNLVPTGKCHVYLLPLSSRSGESVGLSEKRVCQTPSEWRCEHSLPLFLHILHLSVAVIMSQRTGRSPHVSSRCDGDGRVRVTDWRRCDIFIILCCDQTGSHCKTLYVSVHLQQRGWIQSADLAGYKV